MSDKERTAWKGRRWRARLAVSLRRECECEWNQLATLLAEDDVVVAGGGFGVDSWRDGGETISG